MNVTTLSRVTAAVALSAGLGLAGSVPASASGGGGVQKSGTCSAGSTWTLKAKSDNGQLEVEAEVDTNVVGQLFKWKLLDNGTRVAKGKDTTAGASGSFTVRRLIADQAGKDKIVFKATNPDNGEMCRGSLTI